MTLRLLTCCYQTWGKWKIMPLSSASSERKLILWFLSQTDTCETYNCKTVPVEEWEGNGKGVSQMWQNEGVLLLNWTDRGFIINYLTLTDRSTWQTCGWEWVLLRLLNKRAAMYIALPPCNLPRYQQHAFKGQKGKKREPCDPKPAQVLQCFYQNSNVVSKDVAILARSGKPQPLVLATSSNFA